MQIIKQVNHLARHRRAFTCLENGWPERFVCRVQMPLSEVRVSLYILYSLTHPSCSISTLIFDDSRRTCTSVQFPVYSLFQQRTQRDERRDLKRALVYSRARKKRNGFFFFLPRKERD